MRVPFTWKVTGRFMVGWSPASPVGEALPLCCLGEDPALSKTDAKGYVALRTWPTQIYEVPV